MSEVNDLNSTVRIKIPLHLYAMPRKNIKAIIRPKVHWSRENKGCSFTVGNALLNEVFQGGTIIVPPSTTQGVRTVGRWSITVPVPANQSSAEIFWAIVYVPQGTQANALFATTQTRDGSLYEPNQFVLASGLTDATAGPIRIKSNMKRRLHSGDFVSLIIGYNASTAPTIPVNALVSYSVKYN